MKPENTSIEWESWRIC